MCARGPAEAAGRRAGAGARNEASLRRGRWRRGGKGCSYYSTLSEIPVVRKRAVMRLREVRRLATSRLSSAARRDLARAGRRSFEFAGAANSQQLGRAERRMDDERGSAVGPGYARNLRTIYGRSNGLRSSLFASAGQVNDCSHISGLCLRNRSSSGPDGIRWLTPHQGYELWVRGSYQVWSTTVLPVSPSH